MVIKNKKIYLYYKDCKKNIGKKKIIDKNNDEGG